MDTIRCLTELFHVFVGFWDDVDNLDRELSMFVAGMWTALKAADGLYYYNQVSQCCQA